jgi:hypothetical protein
MNKVVDVRVLKAVDEMLTRLSDLLTEDFDRALDAQDQAWCAAVAAETAEIRKVQAKLKKAPTEQPHTAGDY